MGFNGPEKRPPESKSNTKKKEKKGNKEKVPGSNEAAQKKAAEKTEKAKKTGSEKIQEKKEKKKPAVITICGRTILRIKKNGNYVFKEKGKDKPIANLSAWIKERMKDPKGQKTIDTHLSSYQSYFKKLEEGKRKN